MKYKVGDRVLIKSLDWYNENKTKHGDVWFDDAVFTGGQSLYCGCELTIRSVEDDRYYVNENDYYWMDGMIERLVERNGKIYPYKIGDKVILKGNNRSATITDLKYNSCGNLSYYIKIDGDRAVSIDYPTELLLPYDNAIEGSAEEENNDCEKCGLTDNSLRCLFMDNCPHKKQKNIIEIPEGYVFKDENDNVINATKIILEKKSSKANDIIKWLREHDMTKYIGVIYSGMCSITFDTEKLIKDITKTIGDE